MRRRLLLTTDAVGGVWTYSLDLARALAAAEDLVVLLAVLGPSPTADQLTEAAAIPGLQLIDTGLPLDWIATQERDVRAAGAALADLAEVGAVELVQLHTPALALPPYSVPVVSVVHSCVASWWQAVHGGALPADLDWRAQLVREGLQRSDRVVAPSQDFARTVRDLYGLRTAPLPVPNGRRSFPVALSGPPSNLAVTAGRLWDAGKNVAAFDRAAALSGTPFLAAGPLAGLDGVAASLSHAQASGALSSEELAALLAQRPIFVSAALYEPFGLAVLEAAQAGCALVLADRPVFRELWGEAAIFVEPLDPQSIAGAVDHLAADPEERQRLGSAAAERAARYTPEATARAMLDVYASLLPAQQKAAA